MRNKKQRQRAVGKVVKAFEHSSPINYSDRDFNIVTSRAVAIKFDQHFTPADAEQIAGIGNRILGTRRDHDISEITSVLPTTGGVTINRTKNGKQI